ncbi:MAG TPA: N-acetylmuramoyl-L-alanine amidase [Chloroflexota bacterium]|nr:N-acetylmuramoyl-L-alanine amidase [Chloroflexota bacterium]
MAWLAALLVAIATACSSAGPVRPAEEHRPPGAAATPVALVAPPLAGGADPLEAEEEPPTAPVPAGEPGDGPASPAALAAPLPPWLRPVREPPPLTVIGSGRPWPKRVGLQVGHWWSGEVPAEMERLRAAGGGATGGGYTEVEVNLDLATRTAALLRAHGVEVDLLPGTVPIDYRADAFVAIHADGDARGVLRGYKVARSPLSHIPEIDDALVEWLYAEYGRATGLPRDDEHITRRMLFYYAFNNRRYYHAIAPGTPAAIIEAGFLTSAADRTVLIGAPDRAAQGLANGILGFLGLNR